MYSPTLTRIVVAVSSAALLPVLMIFPYLSLLAQAEPGSAGDAGEIVEAAPLPDAVQAATGAPAMAAAGLDSLPAEIDTPEYWLDQFNGLNTLYQAHWTRPVDGPHENYARSDGSIVAWVDTRYALAAYLDLYHWSKDTQYLDWFVERMAQLIPYRRDVDGNGDYSWATAKYWDSLVKNGGFEKKLAYWPGMTSTQLLTSTSTMGMLVVPPIPGKCTSNLPSTFLAAFYVQLAPGESISQSYPSPASSDFYRLQVEVNIPAGEQLDVRLAGTPADLLATTVEHSAVSGPEGWQQFSQDFTVTEPQTVTLSITAPGSNNAPVQLDNIVLTPYLDMYTGDMQMAAVLANFALLVDEHPELAAYRPPAAQYQALAEEVLAKYQGSWLELDSERGVYLISQAEPYNHPYNHVSPAGEALLMLSKLNSGEKAAGYLRQAIMLGNAMRSQMWANKRTPDALSWNYMDDLLNRRVNFKPRVEDTTHTGNNVPFFVLMHDAGYVFSDDDMRQFGNALAGLWNGSYDAPSFYNFLDTRDDIVGPAQFPYMRHISLVANEQLQQASMVAWQSRQRKVQCIRDAAVMSNGWIMSLPAATLRYRFPQRDTVQINVVVDGPAAASFSGDLGNFVIDTPDPLTGKPTRSFTVQPGSYRISQVLPAGWKQNGVRCTLTGGAATQIDGSDATVTLQAGEDVTCTFVASDGPTPAPTATSSPTSVPTGTPVATPTPGPTSTPAVMEPHPAGPPNRLYLPAIAFNG